MGQLAVDVLLSSVDKPQFVTSIYHPSIIPVVGADPLNLKSDQLMTACQLYKTENEAILQLRCEKEKYSRAVVTGQPMGWARFLSETSFATFSFYKNLLCCNFNSLILKLTNTLILHFELLLHIFPERPQ